MRFRTFVLCLSLLSALFAKGQDTVTIVAVGDVMYGSFFPKVDDLADEATAAAFFDEVKPYFEDSDIRFSECCRLQRQPAIGIGRRLDHERKTMI